MEDKQCIQLLEAKNIRPTAMRILTLDFLLKQSSAVSLSGIENYFSHSDRITLYRTLKTFEKKGLIHSIQENNTAQYFICHDDCNENQHHDYHLHFYCQQCRETVCLEETDLSGIKIPENYTVQELQFLAKGICDKCKAKSLQ